MRKRILALMLMSMLCINTLGGIKVVSYNVKGDVRTSRNNGIWTQSALRAKQVALLNQAINSEGVEFIALQQTIVDTNSGAYPDISSTLTGGQWRGIFNSNHKIKDDFDEASIYYDSSKWELNSSTTLGGYWKDDNDVRPYVMAYFKNKASDEQLLFASTHFPHVLHGHEPSVNWNITQFISDIKKVTNLSDAELGNLKVIIAGDMNEIGQNHSFNDLPKLSNLFGQFSMVPIFLNTCCKNDNYSYTFDQVITNKGEIKNAKILLNELYPLGTASSDEEHKAIIVDVEN